ncbi:MAG: hypothetical protein V4736_07575, partial [Bdellovibrionota bacterium]
MNIDSGAKISATGKGPKWGSTFFIILIISIVAFAFFWQSKKSEDKVVQAQPPSSTKLIDVAKQSPGRPVAENDTSGTNCQNFFTTIETTSFNALIADIRDKKLILPSQDCGPEAQQLKTLWDGFAKTCAQPDGEECETALLMFRASRLTEFYKNLPISAQPFEAVVQKLFALLSQNKITTKQGLLEFREAAQELASRDQGNKGAAKAVTLSFLLEKVTSVGDPSPTEGWNPQKETDFITNLERAKELNPEDSQLQEASVLNYLLPVTPEKQAALERLAQSQPNSGLTAYMQGCAAWKLGQKERAIYHLQRAAALVPDEKRFQETFRLSQTAAP